MKEGDGWELSKLKLVINYTVETKSLLIFAKWS